MLFEVPLGIIIYFFICGGDLQITAEDATTNETPVTTPQIIASSIVNVSSSTSTMDSVKPDTELRLNTDAGDVKTSDSDHKKLAHETAVKQIALENSTHLELHAKLMNDILIPHHEREASKNATYKLKNAITDPNLKWPNNTIYYVIDNIYNYQERTMITNAMNFLQQEVGCISFTPVYQTYTGHHIFITDNNGGCNSYVGYRPGEKPGTYEQDVNLNRNGCFVMGAVQHELLHTLGLDHEHNRPDRDDYVYIYPQDITPGYQYAFNIAQQSTTFGVAYDYGSVLHYINTAFGIPDSTGQPLVTIVARKNPQMCLGQYNKATQCDLEKVRHIYNCPLKNNCAPSERQPNPQTNSCYY